MGHGTDFTPDTGQIDTGSPMGFAPADLATAAKAAALFASPASDARGYLTYARLTYTVQEDTAGMSIMGTNTERLPVSGTMSNMVRAGTHTSHAT